MNAFVSLDHFLYYDEDHDMEPEDMPEWTPIEPGHLVELYERGLLQHGEVLSHKNWHHSLRKYEFEYDARMWDGPMEVGEYRWNNIEFANFDDEWV